ncbi:MAG: hypothetical protein Q4F54_03940 [Coriobacteriia bacterium]|nr:hypothetical protein [Coriobacteriia bacterium]
MEALTNVVQIVDDAMYAYIIVGLLLLCGIYFSFRTKFIQIR